MSTTTQSEQWANCPHCGYDVTPDEPNHVVSVAGGRNSFVGGYDWTAIVEQCNAPAGGEQ